MTEEVISAYTENCGIERADAHSIPQFSGISVTGKMTHGAGRSAGWGFSLGLVKKVSGKGMGLYVAPVPTVL
jgi:hypothetical protein